MSPTSNNSAIPSPSSYSPLSVQGHSLNQGVLTCNEGLWSNVSEILRTSVQAKTLNNFQMLKRGVWSNPTGLGWQPQRAGKFNSGAAFMDFGIFEDFLGNQTMLFQVGNQVYSYNLATSTETAYNAPLSGLSTSLVNLPCMRPFVDTTGVVAPITVYCNGDIQPVAITGTSASNVRNLNFFGNGNSITNPPSGGVFGTTITLSSGAAPQGITTGPDNRIWFCDSTKNCISALTAQGVLTEYPLPHASSGPLDICSDGTNLWFTEFTRGFIGKITTAGVITEYSLGGGGPQPVGIVFMPLDGNLYFTESGTSKIGRITTGGVITTFATTTPAAAPWGICTDGTFLYACESATNLINKFTTALVPVQTEYTVPTANSSPMWIAFDGVSKVWFTENAVAGNNITSMTSSGGFIEYPIPTASARPLGITLASDGNLYFVENGTNKIGRSTLTGAITEYAIPVTSSGPYGIADGPDQSIWFTMNSTNDVGNFQYGGSGTWPGVFQLNKKTYSKPKYCTYFNNRMAYFGFDPTTNAALDVLISNQGTAENFTTSPTLLATDAVAFTIPGLGLPTGITAFRLTNTNNQEVLVLGYQRGIAVVMGNGVTSDATTYQADILTAEYGLMSNRTFNQIQNDLYFLSTNGVRNFSNLTVNANLLNSNLTFQMQDFISSITTTPIAGSNVLYNSQAFAVHHRATLEVQFWVPLSVDGTGGANFQNQHAIIMNYNTATPVPQQITPIFSTKSNTSVSCGIEFQGVMYGGGYDGFLQKHYTGNTYNGGAIGGNIGLALVSGPSPQQNIELRQGLVITEGGNQNFNVLTYFYTKQVDGTMLRTPSPEEVQTLIAEVGGLTILGSVQFIDWTLGFSSFPANHIKQLYFEASGEGPYMEFNLSTNGIDQSLDFGGLAYTITTGGLRP